MNELLMCIDQIDQSVNDAEINVLEALIGSYDKALMILQESSVQDYSAFEIFQEGEILDAAKGSSDESIIKRILLFIPRFVKALIQMIVSKYKNWKSSNVKKSLDDIDKFDPDDIPGGMISRELKESCDNKNLEEIRSIIAGRIYWDRRLSNGAFNNALKYVSDRGIDIYQPYDASLGSVPEKSEYDDNDFVDAVYNLKRNFCEERIEECKRVGTYIDTHLQTESFVYTEAKKASSSFVRQLYDAGGDFLKRYDDYNDSDKIICKVEVLRKMITSNFDFNKVASFMGTLNGILDQIENCSLSDVKGVKSLFVSIERESSDYDIDVKFDNTKWMKPISATPISDFKMYIDQIEKACRGIESKKNAVKKIQSIADNISVNDDMNEEYKDALNDLASIIRRLTEYCSSLTSEFSKHYSQLETIVNDVNRKMKAVGVI